MERSYSNISFKGYDAIPLKALYMQGIGKRGEQNIFREMKSIAQKEGIDLYLNQHGKQVTTELTPRPYDYYHLPVWGQDNRAFVMNKNGKVILWKTDNSSVKDFDLGSLSEYKVNEQTYMPRGGNYYIGYKENGDKWLLINSSTVTSNESFEKFKDTPTIEHIKELFDVEQKNIFMITDFSNDLDEFIRPVGYPNILVNDYNLSMENLEKMKQKFPKSNEVYKSLKIFLERNINQESTMDIVHSADEICNVLKTYGFNPIKIGGRYLDGINYMNSIVFRNNKGSLSYITNSTKKSYPEFGYLEKLFEEDLRKKVPDISDTYFVSGGKRTEAEKNSDSYSALYRIGLKNDNVIMDILANRLGGIHCMTAEVPDFSKIHK